MYSLLCKDHAEQNLFHVWNRRPNKRRFRRANSGVVFEFHQKDNPGCSPVIFLLASDASFSGQHRSHHPIYRK